MATDLKKKKGKILTMASEGKGREGDSSVMNRNTGTPAMPPEHLAGGGDHTLHHPQSGLTFHTALHPGISKSPNLSNSLLENKVHDL